MDCEIGETVFEPKIGRAGRDRGASLLKLRAAIRIAGRIGQGTSSVLKKAKGRSARTGLRNHFAKGSASRARPVSTAMRRVVVKARFVAHAGGQGAPLRVHVAYLAREARSVASRPEADDRSDLNRSVTYLSRQEETTGTTIPFYNQRENGLDGKSLTSAWASDARHFRLIISAEDGAALGDLRPFIREVMAGLETKLATKLEWLAVDHHDTDNPHSHVLLRGRRANGKELFIPSRLIASGIREHAQEIVTRALGPRQNVDLVREHAREIEVRGPSPLDRELLRARDRRGDIHTQRPDLLARLERLEGWDLATKTQDGWTLASDIGGKLKALATHAEVEKALGNVGRIRGAGEVRSVETAGRTIGELVHFGPVDDLGETFLAVVENDRGEMRYATLDQADDLAQLDGVKAGAMVAFEPRRVRVRVADEAVVGIAVQTGGVYSIEHHKAAKPGASDEIMAANVRRLEAMRRAGLVERDAGGVFRIPADHLDRALAFEQKLVRRSPVTVAVQSHLPLRDQILAAGPTRLDRILSGAELPLSGKGRVATAEAAALQQRRMFLIEQGVLGGKTDELDERAMKAMAKTELGEAARRAAQELGVPVLTHPHGTVQGVYAQRVDLAQGRVAIIMQDRQAFMVPWRPALERFAGRKVVGVSRGQTLSWSLARKLGPDLPPM
jgi:hypothetical protein